MSLAYYALFSQPVWMLDFQVLGMLVGPRQVSVHSKPTTHSDLDSFSVIRLGHFRLSSSDVLTVPGPSFTTVGGPLGVASVTDGNTHGSGLVTACTALVLTVSSLPPCCVLDVRGQPAPLPRPHLCPPVRWRCLTGVSSSTVLTTLEMMSLMMELSGTWQCNCVSFLHLLG